MLVTCHALTHPYAHVGAMSCHWNGQPPSEELRRTCITCTNNTPLPQSFQCMRTQTSTHAGSGADGSHSRRRAPRQSNPTCWCLWRACLACICTCVLPTGPHHQILRVPTQSRRQQAEGGRLTGIPTGIRAGSPTPTLQSQAPWPCLSFTWPACTPARGAARVPPGGLPAAASRCGWLASITARTLGAKPTANGGIHFFPTATLQWQQLYEHEY